VLKISGLVRLGVTRGKPDDCAILVKARPSNLPQAKILLACGRVVLLAVESRVGWSAFGRDELRAIVSRVAVMDCGGL
jgi:hypothetical protein